MKNRLNSLLLVSTIVIAPQIASATLLVGFYDFTNTQATEGQDYNASGYSGTITKLGSYVPGAKSNNVGGSIDGTYGNANFGVLNPPTTANGYVVSSETWLYNNDTNQEEFVDHSFAVVRFDQSNSQAGSTALGSLLFDAATKVAGSSLAVYYTSSAGPSGSFNVTGLPNVTSPTDNNFTSYALSLVGLDLAPGGWIEFKFDGNTTARMDNIALTAVPETSSFLVLGCLVGGGTLLRSRRRK